MPLTRNLPGSTTILETWTAVEQLHVSASCCADFEIPNQRNRAGAVSNLDAAGDAF
jgi:hypothetical protein